MSTGWTGLGCDALMETSVGEDVVCVWELIRLDSSDPLLATSL